MKPNFILYFKTFTWNYLKFKAYKIRKFLEILRKLEITQILEASSKYISLTIFGLLIKTFEVQCGKIRFRLELLKLTMLFSSCVYTSMRNAFGSQFGSNLNRNWVDGNIPSSDAIYIYSAQRKFAACIFATQNKFGKTSLWNSIPYNILKCYKTQISQVQKCRKIKKKQISNGQCRKC